MACAGPYVPTQNTMECHENLLVDSHHNSAFLAFAGFTVVIMKAEALESKVLKL